MSQTENAKIANPPSVATPLPRVRGPAVTLIAALGSNGVIGAHGRLPWHLSEDLRRFKALTTGHAVIMGRKTWESIGRPLPGRTNIVVTRNPDYEARGAVVAKSLDAALDRCMPDAEVFVIGGGELYALAMPVARTLQLTEIHREYSGIAVFPDYDRSLWREVRREQHVTEDGLRYDFAEYGRVSA